MIATEAGGHAADTLTRLDGVGPAMLQKFDRLDIRTIPDLLFHLPARYQDRTRVTPIGNLRPGDEAVIEGTVEHAEIVIRRRRMLIAQLEDGTGSLNLRFFHFGRGQQQALSRGVRLRCFGEVRAGSLSLEMVHPEYRRVARNEGVEAHLTPVYPVTEGLRQSSLRKLVGRALARLDEGALGLDELVARCPRRCGGLTLRHALSYIHRPPPDADQALLAAGRHPAQRRLAYEELLAHQLSLLRLRMRVRDKPAPVICAEGALRVAFETGLTFVLTGAQRRVIGEIMTDLARPRPMLRLLQGDVGAGKTVVAAAACLAAVEAGYQAAIMAPTEVLAEQHFRTFSAWLAPLGLQVVWLSGKLRAPARRLALAAIENGEAGVIVGTHALFQEGVIFKDLALVVIDEQHRFGVYQRLALRDKGRQEARLPHQLIMTATPIPRTLAMTAYADLDYSVIDQLPPGRKPVKTVALADTRRGDIIERISRACGQGRQAYWVCTLIEESETLQCRAAEDTHAQLAQALPQLRVGLLHGRMKADDKQRVMAELKARRIDLLVATTVIEVGVDVPDASLMIIENAERLGLAQLHQLRGRVGRGATQSSCVLLYHPPLGALARERLDALRRTSDGFEIARIDLELRGPGEVLGTRQTGMPQLRIADISRDQDMLPEVRAAAQRMIAARSPHVEPLLRRWLGESLRFGRV
ncbi:MAG: ATP-dependent DNA helicase RecG [Gammaproteobacteria bacterium]